MPSSRPNAIPTIIHLIRQLKPKSILDIGVGFGKWGHLFREYTDILEAENDPRRYQRENWQVTIDGIEGHAAYLTDMHRYLYNAIHVGDARELLPKLGRYDVIFMGDIIEHFDKPVGINLLSQALDHCAKAVIVSTPKYETEQSALCGNELERHRSLWSAKDFRKFEGAVVTTIGGSMLLAAIIKPGVSIPICKPQTWPRRANLRRLRQTVDQLAELIPLDESFILVDDEQIRSQLPHTHAIPFLERDGQYWGPPPDDETAIREFERLRKAGAKWIVFTWPAFWWLDYYRGFQQHLRSALGCVREDRLLVVFGP